MSVNSSSWNANLTVAYLDILGFINGKSGDGRGNQSSFTLSDFNKPTAVANYIIILIFLFPVVVMSIMCFLRIRVNMISRRDKGYWRQREYLYRVHSLASAAPVAPELSQPLTNGHLSKSGSCSSQSSKKSKESDKVNDDSIKSV
ncbi:uncharacterized protein LOC124143605 [Haliotis rufescens]|uniref:uncharacterized protein LOC124143605 n=1 Tax=Haliotis rufescens TaxID=6454 RepID=UPI001EB03A70|nr:uncharacterized protein LOC124143605 [Haliotis rufescens]